MARGMTMRRAIFPAILCAMVPLAGCAADQENYPSLAIRDQERVSGVFDPVEADPFVPTPQSGEVLNNLASLRADAAAAHSRVLAAAERARVPVAAARGAEIGGDAWSAAAIALADVEAGRSETMLALAQIDLIHTAARIEGGELDGIVSALSEVEAMLIEEDRLIAALNQTIGR